MAEPTIGVAARQRPVGGPLYCLPAIRSIGAQVLQHEDGVKAGVPIARQRVERPAAVGLLIAQSALEDRVRLWRFYVQQLIVMHQMECRGDMIVEVAVLGNRYGTVRVWDVGSRKEVKTLAGHASDVWAIAFSPDRKTLAAADTDWKKPSKIKLWDTTTWKERGSLSCPGEILCLAYSPKGDWLAAGSWDKTVRLFALQR
jgi:hypothetical protein